MTPVEVLMAESLRQLDRASVWNAHTFGLAVFGSVTAFVLGSPWVMIAVCVVGEWACRRSRACLRESERCSDALDRLLGREDP